MNTPSAVYKYYGIGIAVVQGLFVARENRTDRFLVGLVVVLIGHGRGLLGLSGLGFVAASAEYEEAQHDDGIGWSN
jgi:hypothetical protein